MLVMAKQAQGLQQHTGNAQPRLEGREDLSE